MIRPCGNCRTKLGDRKESFQMNDERMTSDESSALAANDGGQPALALASATLLYQDDGADNYFPVNRLTNITIGRNRANNISLEGRLLSRDHAVICCSATGVCELSDLDSSNGTRVNGELIDAPLTLRDGDVIQLGEHVMTFIQNGQSERLIVGGEHRTTEFPPNSLITALSVNVRGYTQFKQLLGEHQTAALMADVAAIAGAIFEQHGACRHRSEGSAVHGVWAHHDDWWPARSFLNILASIAEIQIRLRPLQKLYNLLRPITFGCGIATGHAVIENVENNVAADREALCSVVQNAYRLETATNATGCDILVGQGGLDLLSPPLSGDLRLDRCSVSLVGEGPLEPACALDFGQMGMLSAGIAGAMSKSSRSV